MRVSTGAIRPREDGRRLLRARRPTDRATIDVPGPRRLYLHVGLQKTGTSYLQAALLEQPRQPGGAGPRPGPADQARVLRADGGGARPLRRSAATRPRTAPSIDRFTAQLDAAPRARARSSARSRWRRPARPGRAAARRLRRPGGARGRHRPDLARAAAVLLAGGAQGRRHGAPSGLPAAAAATARPAAEAHTPWMHLDPPAVLARWARPCPADRIHVVTVPPSGQPDRRCCWSGSPGVLDVDPGAARAGGRPEQLEPRAGAGGGAAPGERRAPRGGAPALRLQRRGEAVLQRPGARARRSRRILVPAAFRPWCEEVAERQAAALEQGRLRRRGHARGPALRGPVVRRERHRATEREVAAASVAALAAMLADAGQRPPSGGTARPPWSRTGCATGCAAGVSGATAGVRPRPWHRGVCHRRRPVEAGSCG